MSNWMKNIYDLALKEGLWKSPELSPITAENPKSILIYGANPWFYGGFERMVSVALRLRGHDVTDFYCEGGFPACGMEYHNIRRPSCKHCIQDALQYYNIFGIDPVSLTRFMDASYTETDYLDLFRTIGFKTHYHLDEIVLNNFKALHYEDLEIGKRVFQKVFWYFGGLFEDVKALNQYIFKCAVTYIQHVHIARSIFNWKHFDCAFLHSGTTIQISPFFDSAQQCGIDVVTWWSASWNFDHNEPAYELRQHHVWELYRNVELPDESVEETCTSLLNWKKVYHLNSFESLKVIQKQYPFREHSYKVLVLTNYFCDASMIGIDSFFESGLEMYLYFIDYAIRNEDIDLFIRVHPTEKTLRTIDYDKGIFGKVFLMDEYLGKLEHNYPNVNIIKSDSDVSTYGLMKISDAVFAYTSTLAVEAPLQENIIAICSDTHYKDKDFVVTIKSKTELKDILDNRKHINRSYKRQKVAALRYAHFMYNIVGIKTGLDFIDHNKRYGFNSLKELSAGYHPFWDNLCESITQKYAFNSLLKRKRLIIPLKKNHHISDEAELLVADASTMNEPLNYCIQRSEGFSQKTPVCPLTGGLDVRLIRSIKVSDLIRAYQSCFKIDVYKTFEGLKDIYMFQCCDTGYIFFYPFNIEGQPDFYAQLAKLPWYYMDWKWEHEIATNLIPDKSQVLELGCAKGSFLAEMVRHKGISAVGIEFNSESVACAMKKGLEVHTQSIQMHSNKYPRFYDVVCAFQVVEHLSDTKLLITGMLTALKPGGKLIFSVPNQDSFLGLDMFNILDMPPHHMNRWNEQSLKSLPRFYPVRLLNLFFEPLQKYHYDYFAAVTRNAFKDDHYLSEKLIMLSQQHPDQFRGHTVLAVYEKLP